MTYSTAEMAVGGGVLALAIGFGIFAMQTADLSVGSDGYPLSASFRSVEGVSVGSDVRLAGVKVGTVTDITLNPDTYRAETQMMFEPGVRVPDDSSALISSEGLLGGNYVEISPGGSPFYYESGEEILDTQGAVSLINLLLRYIGGGQD